MKARGWRLLALAFLPLSASAASQSSFLMPGGPIAAHQRAWLIDVLLLLVIVVLPVFVGLPLILWRYRRQGSGAYRPKWNFNTPLEYAVWGVPCLIVLVMSLLVIGPESRYAPDHALPGPAPLRIQVVGLNWKWLFLYPDQHVASVDHLMIPAGRPVEFLVTSDTTMQSFAIPALGSQIYAMAGMVTTVNLQADKPGHFIGKNTQYNGTGFQNDQFDVEAVPEQRFRNWIDRLHSQPALTDATYAIVAKQNAPEDTAHDLPDASRLTGLPSFSAVAPDFFGRIVGRYAPSAGPTPAPSPVATR